MRQIRCTAERGWVRNFLSLLNEMRPPTRNRVHFTVPEDRPRPEVWMHLRPSALDQCALNLRQVSSKILRASQ